MNVIAFLSEITIPMIFFLVVGIGLANKVEIFSAFTKGAMDGLKVVVGILPTLIGLMVAVGILRESGFLEYIAGFVEPIAKCFNFPSALVPLVLVKMFSSSAATGLLTDIFKEYGADSTEGYLGALLMCCSETIFYTISVYFLATKEKGHSAICKGRWVLAGALFCTLAGTIACMLIVAQT